MATKLKIKETRTTSTQTYLIVGLVVAAGVAGYYFYGKRTMTKEATSTAPQQAQSTITRTASGLGYEVITPADQAQNPTVGQTVQVHYTGWLDDNGQPGAKFDSSVDRGTPFEFPIGLGYVIQGWDEGVIAMKVGEKRRIYIPSNLGYGARGAGAVIPPHANLIFDVELLAIK